MEAAGVRTKNSKYGPSPLAEYSRAVRTAGALLLLEVAPEAINYELRRQHGFSEGQAALVIKEASALIPRPLWSRSEARRGR